MELYLSIAGKTIKIKTAFYFHINENFLDFQSENKSIDLLIEVVSVNKLYSENKFDIKVENDSLISILEIDNEIVLGIKKGIKGDFFANGFFDKEKMKLTIEYIGKEKMFNSIAEFFEMVGLENILYYLDSFVLHSSLVCFHDLGIAFVGPSGIGKSTRANICKTFENAEIINGDRPIITKFHGEWYGFGSPYAGSSNIFINKGVKLSGLFLIKRGSGETVDMKKLSTFQAVKEVLKNSTMVLWNKETVENLFEAIEDLCSLVPVYELICPPDEKFIQILKKEMMK